MSHRPGSASARSTASLFVLVLVAMSPPAHAEQSEQAVPAPDTPATILRLRNWTRAELWRFFEPPPGGGNHEYVYAANRFQFGLYRTRPRYDVSGALQYVQFGGLPNNATGPGPLGLGAAYFAHAGRSNSHQVYLRYLNLRLKELLPGVSLQVGRMPYSSGGESASGDPKIETVKRQRVDARLIGEFEWSLYQRAYDGVRADLTRPRWATTAVVLHPTQGGFEDAAGLMINDVTVAVGSITAKPSAVIPRTDWQAFIIRYIDSREVSVRPDNSGRSASAVDLAINTFGTTLVAASVPHDGHQWDGLLWIIGQSGWWYGQSHRAYSMAAEGGHHWSAAPWRPWVRVGLLRASGDDNPTDDRHGTFFQMLPTVRRYAQSASHSQMNQREVFVQALARPREAMGLRVDVHRLRLATARDLWYFGSGATQGRGPLFGFSTRPSNGSTDLGTSFEVSMDYALSPRWSLNAYLGILRGGHVVRRTFASSTMTFGYVENVVQF